MKSKRQNPDIIKEIKRIQQLSPENYVKEYDKIDNNDDEKLDFLEAAASDVQLVYLVRFGRAKGVLNSDHLNDLYAAWEFRNECRLELGLSPLPIPDKEALKAISIEIDEHIRQHKELKRDFQKFVKDTRERGFEGAHRV